MSRTLIASSVLMVLAATASFAQDANQSTLIANARVIDGTGTPAQNVSVRIAGGKITAVGKLQPLAKETVVDAKGLVLAPGFIDSHSHHDGGIFERRDAPEVVSQGITTIIVGQDGGSRIPLGEFFSKVQKTPASVNVASYVGHNTLRDEVMGKDYKRAATAAEVQKMVGLLERDLNAGALGLSTGLEYEPSVYSDPSEVITLAKTSARFGGRYISHIRSEDVKLDAAIEELVNIGTQTCMPVQISHFKLAIRNRWGDAPAVLKKLDAARARGIDVTADVYPYEYWQSTLTILFPDRNYKNRAQAEDVLKNVAAPEDLILSDFEPEPALVGKHIGEVAALRKTDPSTTLMALIDEAITFNGGKGGRETVIGKSMSEQDIAALLKWPQTNISSDGGMGDAHPRGAGAFPRVLRQHVRENKTLTLEQAIHKMSGLTAQHVGIKDRGTIRAGAAADLVLLNPDTVADRATLKDPSQLSVGIERVWVNGQTVWQGGKTAAARPGILIKRAADAKPFTCSKASR
ncbi:N-acyl-D-amino-acid deacylase family protein [Steroidobacter sp.]|uniref:N-acyl-D-amino-acid deacylase family protein n=1 Tax=Steroidobacter sp. TaxID=1978227 RepID=UPI001A5C57DC|nr:D-aminoacylase [Steroidobacter sp.]MBL8269895.1 D-aminoacylase [Steroidobacter sp.]